MELVNYSDNEESIIIEQPLKVENYDTLKFIEINNFNYQDHNNTQTVNVKNLLRLDHLNSEEQKEVLKLCKRY